MSTDKDTSSSSSDGDVEDCGSKAAAERVADRLREAGLDATEHLIDVHDGAKASTDHDTRFGPGGVDGNYGVYASGDAHGGLVLVDVDDYDEGADADGLAALADLPKTLTFETPHTDGVPGGHHPYVVVSGEEFETAREACEAVWDGAANPVPSWGEVRVHNQYVVGPGSQLNGCDKEWCDECATEEGGRYEIAADRPIATITADDLADLLRADPNFPTTTPNGVDGQVALDAPEAGDLDPTPDMDLDTDEDHYPEPSSVAEATGVDDYDPDGDRSIQDWAICKEFHRYGVPKDAAEAWFFEELPESKVADQGSIDYGKNATGTWVEAAEKVRKEDGSLGTHTLGGFGPGGDGQDDLDAPGWEYVRMLYLDDNDDTPKNVARAEAVRLLNEQEHFRAAKDTKALYRYNPDTGIYRDDGTQHVGAILDHRLESHYSTHERNEIVSRLKDRNWVDRDEFGASPENPRICVANGILDLDTGDLTPHTPAEVFIRRVPVEYDPEAHCPAFDAFLSDVVETAEAKRTIYEVLGHAIHPGYPKAAFLMLYGDGRNGKSTLLDVFERFLGPENVSNRTIQSLADDDFAVADLYGKLANIGGDLPADALTDTGTLKTLTGSDHVTANPKYKQPFSFRNEATLVFSANDPPKIEDESTALARRLVLVNCPNEFTPPDQPGPDQRQRDALMDEIANDEELTGILNRAVEGIQRVKETGQFSTQGNVEAVRERYKRISDPVYAFATECVREDADGFVTNDDLYACYVAWCEENEAPKKDKNVLTRLLSTYLRFENTQKRQSGTRIRGKSGITLTSRGLELLGDDDRDDHQSGLS